MKIPEIQVELRKLFCAVNVKAAQLELTAGTLSAVELVRMGEDLRKIAAKGHVLTNDLSRRKAVTRARAVAMPISEELRAAIRQYHADHPDFTQRQIGNHFGVDGGRVSEALAGFRD